MIRKYVNIISKLTQWSAKAESEIRLCFRWQYNQWIRLPAYGFLLVFYSNHSLKMHRFEIEA